MPKLLNMKVKLFVHTFNHRVGIWEETPCYWELTENHAILRHWDTNKIISKYPHFGRKTTQWLNTKEANILVDTETGEVLRMLNICG